MMNARIFVCMTCSRYSPPNTGEETKGEAMCKAVREAIASIGVDATLRTVECLNGCPKPCTAALRTPGKSMLRFSGLEPEDAEALVEAAETHAKSVSGLLADEDIPERLRSKVSLRVEPVAR